ncbi:SDR family oxidoreductase [Pseudoduganella umbonata]|uniref:NAD(P)-dependent dehydrogenase (Short-subunit alcohol dehydrogenase family) n=1 Tax=Pseudoduganella umbonata TaxID=864828 RepID=A0A4V1ED18_9BURK|nr:SDR family oxidoreductase [Pseudoduganella umbonata]MBB3219441.1 NAD(P)-dependent dehydrogenase (short-subunit alcohol dehydrogenase family) [Pseudoduganella umbonata]QCP09531.1 SDR family oxidoreductase [Pseudoduganella umbonata]
MKTVLITGASSGFGLETAEYFLAKGWQVVATMRSPKPDNFAGSPNLRVVKLDVTDPESIERAVESIGPVDVLVNNAGVGLLGIVEETSMETIREIFETNTLGTIAVTHAMLPHFRQQRSGVIVNVTSATTYQPHPLLAVYTASKAAVNAFSESLALELAQFNVRINLVIPGRAPETPFSKNAQSRMEGAFPEAYSEFVQGIFGRMGESTLVTHPVDVAEAIWQAATDPTVPLRLPAGADAHAMSRAAS